MFITKQSDSYPFLRIYINADILSLEKVSEKKPQTKLTLHRKKKQKRIKTWALLTLAASFS